jgi:hypothetical protein
MPRAQAGPGCAPPRWRLALGLAVALLSSAGLRGAPTAPAPSIRLSPETIRMGAFYGGARLRMEGTTPSGTDVVIVIRGAEEAEFFNRKARVGPVWLNVDRVHVTGAPSLFLRLGGGDIRSSLDAASVEAHQLDDSAIKGRMSCRIHCEPTDGAERRSPAPATPCATGVEPDGAYAELIRSSYLALKTQEGTFLVHPDAVRVAESAAATTRYAAEVDWPRRARPGSYLVEALACRGRSVLGRSSTTHRVVEVVFPARVGALARTHPTAYGAAAVLAAVMAGLAVDMLVRRRRRPGAPRRPKTPSPGAPHAHETVESPSSDERAEPVGTVGGERRG